MFPNIGSGGVVGIPLLSELILLPFSQVVRRTALTRRCVGSTPTRAGQGGEQYEEH